MTQLLVDLKSLVFENNEVFMKKLRDDLLESLKKRFQYIETNKYYTHSTLIDPSKTA